MSGSGGGGGGSPVTPEVRCEDLVIQTQIASPKPGVVSKLKVGDVLTVELKTQAGTVVVVVSLSGKVAGGLASPSLSRLRECLQSGYTYKATVTAIKGAEIRIRVEAG